MSYNYYCVKCPAHESIEGAARMARSGGEIVTGKTLTHKNKIDTMYLI